jgi:hypothetical protein
MCRMPSLGLQRGRLSLARRSETGSRRPASQYGVEEIQACMTGGGPADGIQDVLVNPPANARGFYAADSVEQGGQGFGRVVG